MKYVVIVIISVFAGFVGAWLLFDATVPDTPVTSSHTERSVMQKQSPVIIYKPVDNEVTFAAIENEPRVFNQLLMSWQLAAQSEIPELEALIATCLTKDDPLYSDVMTSILMEKYVALDPMAAYNFVLNESRFNQGQMLGHVFTSWVRYDAEEALATFNDITDQQVKLAVGSRLLADSTLRELGLTDEIEQALGPYAEQITRRVAMQRGEPRDLFESALEQTGQQRRSSLATAIRRWMAQDPSAVLARIANMSNDSDRMFATQFALQAYAQRDPDAALAWLRANDPDNAQLEAQVLSSLAQRDVDQALPLVEDLYRRTGDARVLHNLVAVWANKDPLRALAYVDRFDSPHKLDLYMSVSQGYLEQRPEEALNWLLGLGSEYRQVKMSALSSLAFNNQSLAERALARVTDQEIRGSLMQGIVSQRARYDAEGAVEWLSDYADDPGYASALSSVVWQIANHDPERAARLVDPVIDESRAQQLVSPVFQNWYQRDPDAALDWINGLPAGVIRERAILQAIGVVARTDVDQAREMLDALPQGQDATNARFQIAMAWSAREPDRIEYIIEELDLPEELAANLRQRSSGFRIYR